MKYRILDPTEWERLKDLLDPAYLPAPEVAKVAIAEDEQGNIHGFLFLQMVFHMEPLVLFSPKVSFERLHQTLYNDLSDSNFKGLRFYCFSDKEIVNKMAEHVGMKKLPFNSVFEQEVV